MKKKIIPAKNYYGHVNTLGDDSRVPKYVKQFKKQGFDDTETWSLYSTILRFILPRLKRFREIHNGFPIGMTEETWKETIDKMIVAMELINEDDPSHWSDKEKCAQIDEGMKLFQKWFMNLWW